MFNFFNNIILTLETKICKNINCAPLARSCAYMYIIKYLMSAVRTPPTPFSPTHYYLSKENYGPKEKASVGRLIFLWFRSFINKRKKVVMFFFFNMIVLLFLIHTRTTNLLGYKHTRDLFLLEALERNHTWFWTLFF